MARTGTLLLWSWGPADHHSPASSGEDLAADSSYLSLILLFHLVLCACHIFKIVPPRRAPPFLFLASGAVVLKVAQVPSTARVL